MANRESKVLVRTMKAVAPTGFKRQGAGLLAEKAGISREEARAAVLRAVENLSTKDLKALRGIQIIALM